MAVTYIKVVSVEMEKVDIFESYLEVKKKKKQNKTKNCLEDRLDNEG